MKYGEGSYITLFSMMGCFSSIILNASFQCVGDNTIRMSTDVYLQYLFSYSCLSIFTIYFNHVFTGAVSRRRPS